MQRFQQSRHALGSTAYLTVVLKDDTSPGPILADLWQRIDDFERRFSRFLPDSELSRFNLAAGATQKISPEFTALLATSVKIGELTNGLYNPFILPYLQRAGYKGSWPEPHKGTAELDFESRGTATWGDVDMDTNWARIPENSALDFGGIGKGYLLDQLAEVLADKDVNDYWLSLGGDILCHGYDVTGDPWRIAIQHARIESKVVAAAKNAGKKLAVATSGITKRQGISDHGAWHHIIDPRTSRPAVTDVLTTSVCSNSGTHADVAAKCLVIVGSKDAEQTLRKLGEQNALLQIAQDNEVAIEKIGTIWSA